MPSLSKALKLACIIACGFVFFFLALNLHSEALKGFDLSVTNALVALRSPALTALLKAITALASPYALLAICLALMFGMRRRHYAIPVAVNLMAAVFLNFSIKTYFLRERPPLELRLVSESGFSFPSGHAMASLAFYGFLIYIVRHSELKKRTERLLTAALALLIALIGFSRVYLAAHYLTDVLAGFAVSLAYLILYTSLVGMYLRAGQREALETAPANKNHQITASFRHAFDGIADGIKGERNMLIHFASMAFVTVFGFLFSISQTEWLVCVVLFGLVVGAELINTAIETTVDICMPHIDPRAKIAKDVAAGAVLAVSVAAAIAGLIIFVPKILPKLPYLG